MQSRRVGRFAMFIYDPTFKERADQAAEQLADLLMRLRDRGIDPDTL
ncbi:hypothetical protein [Sivoneniella epilithica]